METPNDRRYVRLRATADDHYGPWSASASFRLGGPRLHCGNELYDPLINGLIPCDERRHLFPGQASA